MGLLTKKLRASNKKCDMEKGHVCFIDQVSHDFHKMDYVTYTNLVNCGYFDHKTEI